MTVTEQARLAALIDYDLLDAPVEAELTALVRAAAAVAGVPTATINIIDSAQQCQLTTVGFEGTTSSRDDSMCAVRMHEGRTVYLPDARTSPDYVDNPWVTGRLAHVRLYLSAPLITAEGAILGTLCVFHDEVRELSAQQIEAIEDLATVIVALFERRREARRHAETAAREQEQRALHQQALQQLEERQEFTDAVLDTIEVGVVAAGPDGRLTLFNRTAQQWHGLPADFSVDPAHHGQYYRLLTADGATPLAPEDLPLRRALVEGALTDAEMVIAPVDGPNRQVVVNGRGLHRRDGALLGAVVAQHDVTRDRAQRAALEAAQHELQRSNTELAQLASVASHDLRSPLTVIEGYLDLLTDEYEEDLEPQALEWIGVARKAAARMQGLIAALLKYARVESGDNVAEPVELDDVAGQALADLQDEIARSGAELEVQPLPRVRGDAVLLRQLVQNLVNNAIKYRRADVPSRITVSASVDDGPERGDDTVTVTVADNGHGIPDDQLDRVFGMFAKADNTDSHGHGIGLATCHRIVDRHGGRIWAEHTPGGGATLRFTLPRA
ncbi:MAG: sensor histidine kinase [Jatrophihabitans sp.]|uniref:sensor histidine kinase n=1 Tax=Jatrophihabitans sp. TaxID=1932789 RepID=UPI003F7F816F